MSKTQRTFIQNASHIFRANDIRGIFGKDFDFSFADTLGAALAILLKNTLKVSKPTVLLGHDARLTSPDLIKRLESSLIENGVDVTSIGLAPSPLCYFLLHHYDLTATVVVTASHNPVSHNGFKIMIHKKFNCTEPVEVLKKIGLSSQTLKTKSFGRIFEIDSYSPYINSLKKEFALKPVPFVVDAGNGALGPLAQKVFKDMDLTPLCLFCEPDGRFPNHHPDPTIETHLTELKQQTLQTKSLFGLGFDGDGDRLGLITQTGRFVLGDEFGFLFLKSLLKKGGNVIADVKCSDWFFKAVKDFGGSCILSKSGHSFARKMLLKHQALMALEFSGHIFFNDRPHRGFDDALYNTLRLIELLNKSETSLDNLLPPPNPFQTGELRLEYSPNKIPSILRKIRIYLKQKNTTLNEMDGIRFSTKTAWGLFRPSQTQSHVLTVRFEASSEKEFLQLEQEISDLLSVPHLQIT